MLWIVEFPQPLADVVSFLERGYRMEKPEGCPNEIYDIMKLSWDLIPEKRPNFTVVLDILMNLQSTIV